MLIGILMVVCGIVKYIRYINHMESYFKHLKTKRKSSPFIGNMNVLKAKNGSEFTMNAFKFVMKRDTPLKGNIGPAYFIALDRPEDVKIILMSPQCFDKPYEYSFLPLPLGIVTQRCKIFFRKNKWNEIISFHILSLAGASWKPLRKLMNPTFNLKILQSFLPIFSERTRYFVSNIGNEKENTPFDVLPYTEMCTLDSICCELNTSCQLIFQKNKNYAFFYLFRYGHGIADRFKIEQRQGIH